MEVACARFSSALLDCLPEIEREIRNVTEALDERRSELCREIENLNDTIVSADEDDDISWEEQRLEDARDELSSINRRTRRLEEAVGDYRSRAHNAETLAAGQRDQIRDFLKGATQDLKAYLATQHDASALPGSFLSPSEPQAHFPSQESVRHAIRYAKWSSTEILNGGVNQSMILRNGVSVVFKPSVGEYQHPDFLGISPGTQFLREKAASLIDEMLGLNLVPPTEIINYEGKAGSAQLFKDGFQTPAELAEMGLIKKPYPDNLDDRQRRDWQLLDELIGNRDRHSSNWMLRRRENGSFELALIDNGMSFSECDDVMLKTLPASSQPLDEINRERLEQFLATERRWRETLVDLVGSVAVERMISRAKNLLSRNRYE